MILNSGLDSICTQRAYGANNATFFVRPFAYAAIGTGSTAPTATDTSLDAQVGARSASNGGFSDTQDGGFDAGANIVWAESTITRVIAITSNVNATEWGLAEGASSNLSVRELFRADPLDNGSSPITLTLEDGDELQLVYTIRVEAEWEYQAATFVITGAPGNDASGTHDGYATASGGAAATAARARETLSALWPGGIGVGGGFTNSAYLTYNLTDQSSVGKAQDMTSATGSLAVTDAAYTPGTFYRDASAQFGTSVANGTHYAWQLSYHTTGNAGLRFLLDDPAYLTKTGTHKLSLTVRKSVARL